ncbi:MAG: peptidyl-alpha-hydroxyglycine alpha-amidating lyase family protein [Planctomycetaceae bacterium]
MIRGAIFTSLVLLSWLVQADSAWAQYPKINLAYGYQVDPEWPKKPLPHRWRYVTGVAVDSQDRIWIVNQMDPPVQCYDREGNLVEAWGDGQFAFPHFLRVDADDNIWVADFRKHAVRKFTQKGELLVTLGTPDEAGDDEKHLNGPTDVCIAKNGDLFVTDGYGNNRIMHYNAEGKFIKTWGSLGQEPGQLSQPHGITIDSEGKLYVAERNNCRIQVFNQEGESLDQWRHLVNPWGLWMTKDDELLISGSAPARWKEEFGNLGNPPSNQLVVKFDLTGRMKELWVLPLSKPGTMNPGELDWVHAIAADKDGNIYLGDVADESPFHRIQKFDRLVPEK